LHQYQGVLSLKRRENPRRFATGIESPAGLLAGTGRVAPELLPSDAPQISIELGRYQARLAESVEEREAACRLRFRVFNLELGEGLQSSWRTGRDEDPFDSFCDHLVVVDRLQREIVGTYRMQSGEMAARNLGYYSQREFEFAPYEALRCEVLELGRASIAMEHRTSEVLTLLWRGIAQYAGSYRLRYLIGCSSLNSRDPGTGWSMYEELSGFLTPVELRTRPTGDYELPASEATARVETKVPKLLKTYIAVGARICATPAWDREFGTIDFLTLLDLALLSPAARSRFLPGSGPRGEPARAC
jgi:putative hemolysin